MYGANKSLLQLILELRQDYNIAPIVLLRSQGEFCEVLNQNDIKYIVSHFYWWVYQGDGFIIGTHNFIKQFRNIKKVNNIINKIRLENIDLVYSNSITINIGAILSAKLKRPHIWHFRETMRHYDFKFSSGVFYAKKFLQKPINNYITISDFLTLYYQNFIPNIKMKRIYNGFNFFDNMRINNKLNGQLKICILGIVSKNKNQLDAVKAIDELVNKRGFTSIKLHIIGGNNQAYLQQLQEYINLNNLSNFIDYMSHKDNINSILNEMNIGLMCSQNEAFGRVTVEYMLNRMPVIASKSGANEEIVIDGKNGFIYKLHDPIELADKIEYFIKNTDQLETFGSNAQKYAIENFSSTKNTQMVYDVIKEVLKSN